MTKLPQIVAALLAGSVLIQPAVAQAGREPVSVEFSYQNWQSAEANYQRLNRTVKRACVTQGPRPLVLRATEWACMNEMTDLVVQRLDKPALADVHYAETGRSAGDVRQMASNGK